MAIVQSHLVMDGVVHQQFKTMTAPCQVDMTTIWGRDRTFFWSLSDACCLRRPCLIAGVWSQMPSWGMIGWHRRCDPSDFRPAVSPLEPSSAGPFNR